MKLKLCRNVHNIASIKIVFLLPLLMSFHCYGTLKFPKTYNGKSKSRPLLQAHLTAEFLTKSPQKFSSSSPLPKI